MSLARDIDFGSLRRRYFGQKEAEVLQIAQARAYGATWSDFFLDGHRLLSLYRTAMFDEKLLKELYRASFWQKYLTPSISPRKVA